MTKTTNNSPYTNWIGILLVIVALGIWVAQFFIELKAEIDNSVLFIIGGAGLLIWLGLSDETFKAVLNKWKKK